MTEWMEVADRYDPSSTQSQASSQIMTDHCSFPPSHYSRLRKEPRNTLREVRFVLGWNALRISECLT